MQVWIAHNPTRACFIATDGPVVLFEYGQAMHLAGHLPLVDEVRPAVPFFYFLTGERTEEMAGRFAAQIDDLLRTHGGGNRRLAVDKMEIAGVRAFDRLGIDIRDGQRVTEHARKIKDANEVEAMRCAMVACETSMEEMRRAMRPGMTENDLWAVPPRRERQAGRGVDRDPAAHLRTAHQPVVPGVRPAGHRGRRRGRLRHRPHRAVRVLHGYLAHLDLWRGAPVERGA